MGFLPPTGKLRPALGIGHVDRKVGAPTHSLLGGGLSPMRVQWEKAMTITRINTFINDAQGLLHIPLVLIVLTLLLICVAQ